MIPRQYGLSQDDSAANKDFLKRLYETEELDNARRWFDVLRCGTLGTRQPDPGMTLEKFLLYMDKNPYIILQIGSPDPELIRYCARAGEIRTDRFVWMECPMNSKNYQIIERLFREAYGRGL